MSKAVYALNSCLAGYLSHQSHYEYITQEINNIGLGSEARNLIKNNDFHTLLLKLEKRNETKIIESLENWIQVELNTGEIISNTLISDPAVNISTVYEIVFKSGLKVIFKANRDFAPDKRYGDKINPANEVGAYKLSKALGINLVPFTSLGSIILQFNNGKSQEVNGNFQLYVKSFNLERLSTAEKEQVFQKYRIMRVFDYLINNWDRHGQNYIINEFGIFGIDHGISFELAGKEIGNFRPLSLQNLPADITTNLLYSGLLELSDGKINSLMSGILNQQQLNELSKRKNDLLILYEMNIRNNVTIDDHPIKNSKARQIGAPNNPFQFFPNPFMNFFRIR